MIIYYLSSSILWAILAAGAHWNDRPFWAVFFAGAAFAAAQAATLSSRMDNIDKEIGAVREELWSEVSGLNRRG